MQLRASTDKVFGEYETTEGDGGFLDSFNALKMQIDFNYRQYKEQYETLYKRKENLKEDYRLSIKLLVLDLLIPMLYPLLVQCCVWLGLRIKLFSMIYIVLVLGFPVVVFICDFVFAPGLTKNVVAHKKQIIILNSGASMVEYRRKNNITSFEDEKTFLNNKINSIEDFYQEMEIEGWNKKDKHPEWKGLSEMNDEQIAILDRMRSLSLFQECHASVVETRAKVGIGWVIIGFMFAVELAVFVVMLDKTNIGF